MPCLDPAEKVRHRLRWKKITQVYRDHQCDRAVFPALGHLFSNCTEHDGSHINGDRDAVCLRFFVQFIYRYLKLRNTHVLMQQFFAFQPHRIRLFLLIPRCLRRIILRKAVFLLHAARHLFRRIDARQTRGRMPQDQVILHQFLEKMHRSRTVCQRMKYFEIDPVLIIRHLKKQ